MGLLGQEPVPTIHTWGEFATTVGIPTAILFCILWFVRSWLHKFMEDASAREARMAARIDHLEEFNNTTLLTLLGETKAVLVSSTEIMQKVWASSEDVNESVASHLEQASDLRKFWEQLRRDAQEFWNDMRRDHQTHEVLIQQMIRRPCLLPMDRQEEERKRSGDEK